ncbi:MAG: thiolase domain-containing protein [Chloroflexi bacterium]|nr:thiolase domain-containing protein [Chloroflexota bacterium]
MRGVSIIGIGSTSFGRQEGVGIKALAVAACEEAIADAGIDKSQIQAFYLGNYAGESLAGQNTLAPIVARDLGLQRVPSTKVEAACASGSVGLRQGYLMVAAGLCEFVLAAGVEKMTAAPTAKVTEALSAAIDQALEGQCGLTFPGAFALVMQRHMYEYGTTREQLGLVSVKNHNNGVRNPKSQFRALVTLDQVVESRLICDPIRLFDCCPISDGAAAVVICPADRAGEYSQHPIDILASAQALGTSGLYQMPNLTSFEATVTAARDAYQQAGLSPQDIDVVELHDCFTIAEIVDSEDLGFFEKGRGGWAVAEGWTQVDGKIPINTSGGLLSKGHPVGATGLGQIYELVLQLRGMAPNQVPQAEIGLTHNLGGTGAVATVHILKRRA